MPRNELVCTGEGVHEVHGLHGGSDGSDGGGATGRLRRTFGFRISAFLRVSGFGFRISFALLLLSLLLLPPSAAHSQPRPYLGFVYPAGGQQGATFEIRLGGQGVEDANAVLVSGTGVTARITENYRRLNNQEMQMLNEQAAALRRKTLSVSSRTMLMQMDSPAMMSETATNRPSATNESAGAGTSKEAARELLGKIEKRTLEYVQTPACVSIASLILVEVTVAPDAEPGEREIRLVTLRGVSNPLAFHVGQVPEFSRKPMVTATQQVLGKESQALRKRLPGEDEERINVPATVNGQIGSSEVHRYRFEARRGQRLVITTLGRQLVPFIADAVPGWFQPVLALYDASGKEVAYDDDYRFKPDPTLFFEVPGDGEYVFTIHDSLYRGREDFVYRITIGELPFITSIYPVGGRPGTPAKPEIKGWNLKDAELISSASDGGPGVQSLAAKRKGTVSNRVPFAVDPLPEASEQEPDNTPATAQKVTLPVVINGRINRPDDWDVFRFAGKSNETIVAEVQARRLDSPLDSVLKLTDASGNLLAFNDDHEDPAAGLNTHHADSYLTARLPADGTYYLHIGDTARQGGEEYAYRLRLSAPRPDFELRTVPSSLALRSKSTGTLTVYVLRKDGFKGPIKLGLQDATQGFSALPMTLGATQNVGRLTLKTTLVDTKEPVAVSVVGSAKIGGEEIVRRAVPAEDRMQAFLWRQLLPAKELLVLVYDPDFQPLPKRIPPARPATVVVTNAPAPTNATVAAKTGGGTNSTLASTNSVPAKPKFSKQQVAGRVRQIKLLYEEGLLSDPFYCDKMAECEAAE
ncbi:MAG: hypothetical protein NTX51_13090 [Verrucomicrobia bacterium]|nr:hypothetical protein [Verrucomicrobiota bacterium]